MHFEYMVNLIGCENACTNICVDVHEIESGALGDVSCPNTRILVVYEIREKSDMTWGVSRFSTRFPNEKSAS